jgi:DNA-binding NtrC family response regulator
VTSHGPTRARASDRYPSGGFRRHLHIIESSSPLRSVTAAFEQLGTNTHGFAGVRPETLSYRDMLEAARERATRDYLVALMKDVGGNVTRAADRAGVERESMHRLLERHGVRSDDFKPRGS